MTTTPAPTDCEGRGMTGWCSSGRHNGCPYRRDGALPEGIWLPECYVTLPHKGGRKTYEPMQGRFLDGVVAQLPGIGHLMVVRPSHRYKCPCPCHIGGEQLTIFAVTADGAGK